MREIKFREWDPERQKMTGRGMVIGIREEYDDSVSWRFDHEEDLDYTTRLNQVDANEIPYRNLMQYTGLKDRNGVEIFEGDVVKCEQFLTTTMPSQLVSKVSYSDRNTMFYLDDGKQLHNRFIHSLGSSLYTYEVIGNIYENPELLPTGR